MLAYRIENAEGRGPYVTRGLNYYEYAASNRFRNKPMAMPGPYRDYPLRRSGVDLDETFVYAFKSVDDLRKVFKSYEGRKAMKRKGFVVTVYECHPEHYVEGNAQCVFRKEHSKMLHKIDLVKLK